MQLLMFLRRFAVVLPAMGLLGYSSTGISTVASPEPEKLVAEIPIHENDRGDVTYFLPVTIQGHAATIILELTPWGDLGLSPEALKQLGVTLTDTTQLDSLTVGTVTEHHVALQSPYWRVDLSKLQAPPNLPPVIGAAGVKFMSRYDVLYDYPSHKVRLYAASKHPVNPRDAWLPPGIKPTDCGRMVHVPPGAGTYTGVEMQLDGHPVTGVLEMISSGEKINQAAVTAMGVPDSSLRIQPVNSLFKELQNIHMTIGSNMFWKGSAIIYEMAVGELLPNKPIILISLSTIDKVVLFNSNSSGQVCVGKP